MPLADAIEPKVRGSNPLGSASKFGQVSQSTAFSIHLDAWSAALFAGRLATAGGLLDVSRAVLAARGPEGEPRPCDLLLEGFARMFTDGRPAATPVLRRAAAAFAGADVSVEEVLRWGWLATAAAVFVWDFDTCLAISARGVELARDAGALEPRHGMTFDWSELSPGSLLLAQALLDDATATANHGRVLRRFQADVVAAMPKRRYVMTDAEIRSWRAGAGSA